MDVKTTTAVVDTAITGWKVGSQTVNEWTATVGLNIPRFKNYVTYKHSDTASDETSGATDKKDEIDVDFHRQAARKLPCGALGPRKMLRRRQGPKCAMRRTKPVVDFLSRNNWCDNISLPAVNGQLESWNILRTHFYDMTKDGSLAGKV
ncbi:hypothetical protein NOR_05837 [Metarhizium rileyi]|uniref:Uncharacterized protein n=1 Tax=Metarhizium rileyi (strain RCEF 4871) TaxID=1649241 RepID=A0A167BPQ5_METRR|nr:hypothetical protein NOR_05837 [Metarhizium rileyi RCEF 4871]